MTSDTGGGLLTALYSQGPGFVGLREDDEPLYTDIDNRPDERISYLALMKAP